MLAREDIITVLGLFIIALVRNISCINAGCIFNVTNMETEKNLPVPLFNTSSGYEFVIPSQGSIYLEPGQNITLLCSGNRNYLKQINANATTVRCIQDDQVKLFRRTYTFENIGCKKFVKGDLRTNNEKCGHNQGRLYQIGYPVTRKDWLPLISICRDPETANTLYTQHIIYGKEIEYASKTKHRPDFRTAGPHDNITDAYKKDNQSTTFSEILGSPELARQYVNDKSFLARGHLAPHADFLLATAQFSTYHHINAAPQWQSINGGNWKSIEFAVRKLAKDYGGDLEVVTGTHGILSYNDKEDKSQNIFLGGDEILPVPKYFWKLVREPLNKTATVFVILNDPYAKSVKDETFCRNICPEIGFNKTNWKKESTGYVFCCTVDDFRKTVKAIPRLEEVKGVLVNPAA